MDYDVIIIGAGSMGMAAGFSGHGFKFSSAVGQVLSDLIISGKNEIDISRFSIKRFINES
ncbi:hypothetical protein [Paraliobacillus sediminis]|uniref:hypothetical protein n=1 Tax=Paraliobacillus sediminis TaxID=1885916 RepID=UPI00196862E7